jgi:hypothetical protein
MASNRMRSTLTLPKELGLILMQPAVSLACCLFFMRKYDFDSGTNSDPGLRFRRSRDIPL